LRRKVEFVLLILLLAGLIVVSRNLGNYVSSGKIKRAKNTVVIDAGHGGSDPGKVGINKAEEKEINLKIAKKVKKILEKKGVKVVMTREEDTMLSKNGNGSQKVQDMKERVKLINNTKPEFAVSIHQNSYHDEAIHGAQVFYYKHSAEGEQHASIMQKALLSIDKENRRQAKADDTYYLLKRTEVPTIIVECGFLSNHEEAEKLVTDEYQQQVAEAIVKGIEACMKE
jgi:N-acetylmuramoyl-L-alanine amidase CwlD